jgi:hypothetical protein
MKVRRLQQLLDDGQWEDHGYAYERENGSCAFSYNTLVWGRIGAKYNQKLQTAGTNLDEVHTVIPTGDQLRWLEVEEIEGNPEEIKVMLDEACKIPRPRPVSIIKPITA